MRYLKIAIMLVLIGFSSFGFAEQDADNTKAIEKMAKDLGLTDEQKSRVAAIFDEEKQTVEAIFKEEGEKLEAAQQQTRTNLQQVLSDEQMAKLDKKMQQKTKRSNKKH